MVMKEPSRLEKVERLKREYEEAKDAYEAELAQLKDDLNDLDLELKDDDEDCCCDKVKVKEIVIYPPLSTWPPGYRPSPPIYFGTTSNSTSM